MAGHRIVKILIIGGGSIGQKHALCAQKIWPESKVDMVSSYSEQGNELKENKNVKIVKELKDKSYEYYEIGIIANPASLHIETYNKIVSVCKGVLIEKPLYAANKDTEIRNICINTKKKNTIIGYILRFDPIIIKTKKLLEDNGLGNVIYASIWAGQDLKDWRPNIEYKNSVSAQRKLGGGVVHELSHEIDYALHFFGKPDKISCEMRKYSDLDIDVEDNAEIRFYYNSKVVNIHLDFCAKPANLGFMIQCKNGIIKADFVKRKLFVERVGKEEEINVDIENFSQLYQEQLRFLNRLVNRENQRDIKECDISQGLEVMKMIKYCQESNEKCTIVEVK